MPTETTDRDQSAQVQRWLVQPGSTVQRGTELVELVSDHGTTTVQAPETGVLATIHAQSGESIRAGTELATLRTPQPETETAQLRGTTATMSRTRRVIAQRMVDSLHTSAQLTSVVEADVTALVRLRQRVKTNVQARHGVSLSVSPFMAEAAVQALRANPKINASVDNDSQTVTYHDAEHLAIAVDTPRGLLAPVIPNAGEKDVVELARAINEVAQRARDNELSPYELTGGTFTVTNTGSRGVLFDTPIINQPQVAILGTGAVVERPTVVHAPQCEEGSIEVRSMACLALSYDHRLIDGADAARYLDDVKQYLETAAFAVDLGVVTPALSPRKDQEQ